MYPEIEPYSTGFLNVGDGHTLYYEECGNPEGTPLVFLHGGPGGGINPTLRRFFNPEKCRIILFDQRGAGKSTPYASIEHNSIERLISDIEQLRQTLCINKWIVYGISWGSALAQLYTVAHPERVTTLILCGTSFADKTGVSWLTEENGASELMPEWFEPYRNFIPETSRAQKTLLQAYTEIVLNPNEDEQTKKEAVKRFMVWDTALLSFEPPYELIKEIENKPEDWIALCTLFLYFATHHYRDENKEIIFNAAQNLGHIPCHIIHGRYDLICPVKKAFDLHKNWKNSTLYIVEKAGHRMVDEPTATKIIEVTDKILST